MDLEAVIINAGSGTEGAQDIEGRAVARLAEQLHAQSISAVHTLAADTTKLPEELCRDVNSRVRVLLLEAGVVLDEVALEEIICQPPAESGTVVRPLESAFSMRGHAADDPAAPFHAEGHLPMGAYLLSRADFLRLIDEMPAGLNLTVGTSIRDILLRRRIQTRIVITRNSEIEGRPASGPAVREQVPRMLEIGETVVTKRATNGREKLKAEVRWLRQLPEDARGFFSEVLDADLDGDPVSYRMPRYPLKNLEERLYGGELGPEELREALVSVFSTLGERLYPTRESVPSPGYMRFKYVEKIRQRTAAAAALSPLFERYASATSLLLNGRKLPGLPTFLSVIEEDIPYLASMEPPRLHPVHGDMKPDNILMGENKSEFRIIDPMGVDMDDIALDGAKPVSTLQAHHHAFKNGRLELDIRPQGQELHVDTVFLHGEELERRVSAACEEALVQIARHPFFAQDKSWAARVKLHSALIQLAYASYHLIYTQGKEDRIAVGLLARGLEMLHQIYPLEGEPRPRKGRLCNLRYPFDRALAIRMLEE